MVSLAKGPQYMSQVEFTIDRSGEGAVWYDMSSVEGVSGGITMNYTDASGNAQTDVAIPGKFSGSELRVVPAPGIGFPTVLSDKNVQGSCECESFSPSSNRCNTDACYASCPGPLVDNPCGQHRCREWYARQYEDSSSYCGWLYAEGAQTYCWAMDEWKCVDADCGYGGEGQPRKDCSSRYPEDAPANSYSCGHGGSMPGPNGTQWWTSGAGCEDKLVRGVPTNPAPPILVKRRPHSHQLREFALAPRMMRAGMWRAWAMARIWPPIHVVVVVPVWLLSERPREREPDAAGPAQLLHLHHTPTPPSPG
ncbi:unnamed protein product, partial [Prorocentrum cordatum]